MESIQQLFPVMLGEQGFIAAIMAWRGFLALTVPLVNAQLKEKFTQLLADSPTVANSIVEKPWYKTLSLILRMTVDIQLPNENSLIVHQVKEQVRRETAFLNKPNDAPDKPAN